MRMSIHAMISASVSQSVCLSTLLQQLFKCPNALFLYHQRTIEQSVQDASFCFAMHAPCSCSCPCSNATPPDIPILSFPNLSSPSHHPHLRHLSRTTIAHLIARSLRPRLSWSPDADYSWLLPFSQRGIGVLLWGGLVSFCFVFSLFPFFFFFFSSLRGERGGGGWREEEREEGVGREEEEEEEGREGGRETQLTSQTACSCTRRAWLCRDSLSCRRVRRRFVWPCKTRELAFICLSLRSFALRRLIRLMQG